MAMYFELSSLKNYLEFFFLSKALMRFFFSRVCLIYAIQVNTSHLVWWLFVDFNLYGLPQTREIPSHAQQLAEILIQTGEMLMLAQDNIGAIEFGVKSLLSARQFDSIQYVYKLGFLKIVRLLLDTETTLYCLFHW